MNYYTSLKPIDETKIVSTTTDSNGLVKYSIDASAAFTCKMTPTAVTTSINAIGVTFTGSGAALTFKYSVDDSDESIYSPVL